MQRIDSVNARANQNGQGKNGFHDNADLSGQDATYLTPPFMNALQEELCNILEENGIQLNPNLNNQLSQLLATSIDIDALATAVRQKLDQEKQLRIDADNILLDNISTKYDKSGGAIAGNVNINGALSIGSSVTIAVNSAKTQINATSSEQIDFYLLDKPVRAPMIKGGGWVTLTGDSTLGIDQTWRVVTADRVIGGEYENPFDEKMEVLISVGGGSIRNKIYINDELISEQMSTYNTGEPIIVSSFSVPGRAKYRIEANGGLLYRWSELKRWGE